MTAHLNTFIPAGGFGSRLNPHTFDTPKPLLPMGLGNRKLIDGPLDLSFPTSDQVWVSTDYLGEQIEEYLEGATHVETVRDSRTIGSGGSLVEHYDQISNVDPSGSTLILPCDHVYKNLDLKDLYAKHQEDQVAVTLLTVPPKAYGEYVSLNNNVPTAVLTNYVSGAVSTTGIFIVRNKYLFDWVKGYRSRESGCQNANIYRDLICPAIGHISVNHYFLSFLQGRWDDAGTLDRYLENNMLLSKEENVLSIQARFGRNIFLERCVVIGDVFIPDDTRIRDSVISKHGITSLQAKNFQVA